MQCFWPLTHWSTTDIWCFIQVTELKGQLTQVARSGSATSNNILLRSAMISPSTAPSQYDEKHRSVLKKIEKDRKEAQEVRKKNTRAAATKKYMTKAWKSYDRCMVKFLFWVTKVFMMAVNNKNKTRTECYWSKCHGFPGSSYILVCSYRILQRSSINTCFIACLASRYMVKNVLFLLPIFYPLPSLKKKHVIRDWVRVWVLGTSYRIGTGSVWDW